MWGRPGRYPASCIAVGGGTPDKNSLPATSTGRSSTRSTRRTAPSSCSLGACLTQAATWRSRPDGPCAAPGARLWRPSARNRLRERRAYLRRARRAAALLALQPAGARGAPRCVSRGVLQLHRRGRHLCPGHAESFLAGLRPSPACSAGSSRTGCAGDRPPRHPLRPDGRRCARAPDLQGQLPRRRRGASPRTERLRGRPRELNRERLLRRRPLRAHRRAR